MAACDGVETEKVWLTEVTGGQCSLISQLQVQRRTLFKKSSGWTTEMAHRVIDTATQTTNQQEISLMHP